MINILENQKSSKLFRCCRFGSLAALIAGSFTIASSTFSPVSAFSISGNSVTINANDSGSSFTVNFDGNIDRNVVPGLSSQATFNFQGFSNKVATFLITLTNTSSGGILSRTSSLGFNTNPNLQNATVSGLFDHAIINGSYPNGFGNIEICFTAGNNCQGGGNGGVDNNPSTVNPVTGQFTTRLAFDAPLNSLTLSNFGVRYQSISGNGFNGASGTGRGTPVPEPTTILGTLLAGGFGSSLLKRSLKKQKSVNIDNSIA